MSAEQDPHPDVPDAAAVVLRSLARDGALSEQQATSLAAQWPILDAQTWHQPRYRDVREHTRAYIEELRAGS